MNPQPSLTYHKAGIPILINKKRIRQKYISVLNQSMKRNYERRAGLLTLVSHNDCGQGGRVVCLKAPFGLLKGEEKKHVKTAFTNCIYSLSSGKFQEAWSRKRARRSHSAAGSSPSEVPACHPCRLGL